MTGEMVAALTKAIEVGTDDLLTDDEASKLLKICPDRFRKVKAKLVTMGARCFELPSEVADPKRPRCRWSRNSLLALARGLDEADPAAAAGRA